VDVLTVPSMFARFGRADQWLTLDFLRAYQVPLAYGRLEEFGVTGGSAKGAQSLRLEAARLVLRSLMPIFCCSCLVLVLEVLGDPPFLSEDRFIVTGMGDIDFFTMIYWVVETISTVGYGELAPTTELSRVATCVFIFSGVAFLTVAATKVMDIISRQREGSGALKKTSRGHVVLVGGAVKHADEIMLTAFIEVETGRRNNWPDLVVLSPADSLQRVMSLFKGVLSPQAWQRLTFLAGTPLSVADLERCCCGSATLVCIMADSRGRQDPEEEDKENILRAMGVQTTYPDTPLRLMLLMRKSRERALSLGIHRHYCFSVNEMKHGVFWQSCRCLGWSTMLSNLMVTTEVNETLVKDEWLQNYIVGMGHEVYGFLPTDAFLGKPFSYLVREAYKKNGICVMAAQIRGAIVLAPFGQLNALTLSNPIFALAQDEDSLRGIARQSEDLDWRKVFLKNRSKSWQRSNTYNSTGTSPLDLQRAAATMDEDAMDMARTSASIGTMLDGKQEFRVRRELESIQNTSWSDQLNGGHGGEDELNSSETDDNSAREKLDGERKVELQKLKFRAKEFRRAAKDGETPFILLLEISGDWSQILPLIQHSRADYLPVCMPIVVLCRHPPPDKIIKQWLDYEDTLAFVEGTPNDVVHLERAGIKECSTVVCLQAGGRRMQVEEFSDMVDIDVIMLHRMITNLSIAHKSAIFEFRLMKNIFLLGRPHAPPDDVETPGRLLAGVTMQGQQQPEPEDHKAYLDPVYASGQVFTPQVLAGLLGLTFHTPGLLEVMSALMIPDGGDSDSVVPWQSRVEHSRVGETYGRLFETMACQEPPALLLGLYRGCGMPEGGGNSGYVWTNPPAGTLLVQTDVLFLLAERGYGEMLHSRGLLVGSASKPRMRRSSSNT
ncbi:unnamed protein product, partial [Prorocentrum cordatum]